MYAIDHTIAFAIDAPAKASDMQKLDQNIDELDARFNTSTGHDHDGIDSKLVTSVADGAISPAKLSAQTAGDYLLSQNLTERSTASQTYAKVKEIKIAKSGAYRIKFDLKKSNMEIAYGRLYKNGAAVGTERSTNSGTYTTYSEDISGWAAGDLVQVYAKCSNGDSAVVEKLKIYGETPGDFGINESY